MCTNNACVRILIVEDDVHLAELLEWRLAAEGYQAQVCHNGTQAIEKLLSAAVDLVVLDLNLPDMDGCAILKAIRPRRRDLPFLVLTGRNRIEDRVMSLECGADDCLVKPFSLLELSARIKALLRRLGSAEDTCQLGDLVLRRDQFRVERGGREIKLTTTEFKVLEYLLLHAGKAISRAELLEKVWKQPLDSNSNVVDVYLRYLRNKVDSGADMKMIRTVRGVGYMIAHN